MTDRFDDISMSPERMDALIAAMAASATAGVEVGGLSVDLQTGLFRHADLLPGFVVHGRAATTDRGIKIRSLTVDSVDDRGEVGGRVLRQVPVARLLSQIRRRLEPVDGAVRAAYDSIIGPDETRPASNVPRQPGRPNIATDRDAMRRLRAVALAYLEDDGPGAHQRLARQFNGTTAQVKWWIALARRHEFLAPTTGGSRGARPGRLL